MFREVVIVALANGVREEIMMTVVADFAFALDRSPTQTKRKGGIRHRRFYDHDAKDISSLWS